MSSIIPVILKYIMIEKEYLFVALALAGVIIFSVDMERYWNNWIRRKEDIQLKNEKHTNTGQIPSKYMIFIAIPLFTVITFIAIVSSFNCLVDLPKVINQDYIKTNGNLEGNNYLNNSPTEYYNNVVINENGSEKIIRVWKVNKEEGTMVQLGYFPTMKVGVLLGIEGQKVYQTLEYNTNLLDIIIAMGALIILILWNIVAYTREKKSISNVKLGGKVTSLIVKILYIYGCVGRMLLLICVVLSLLNIPYVWALFILPLSLVQIIRYIILKQVLVSEKAGKLVKITYDNVEIANYEKKTNEEKEGIFIGDKRVLLVYSVVWVVIAIFIDIVIFG
jgi:hypothetical protein